MIEPTDLFARAVGLLKSGDVQSAREIAERAIANTGESASLRHFLGVACCQGGDLDAGIGHLERAAELAPRDLGVLLMLMRALIDAGRPRDALSRAFKGDGVPRPALLELWRTRAEAAHRAGDAQLEADALERVILLDQADGRARELLVSLLLSLDRHEAALEQLEAMSPSRSRERVRSSALAGLRRLDEAVAVEQALLAGDPQDREAWLSLVLLADRKGDAALLSATIDLGERGHYAQAEIDFARALLAKRDGRADEALALARASDVPRDPARRFALIASLADRLGRADEAFDAAIAKAAATPERDAWRRRGAAHRADLERTATRMTGAWAAGWSAAPPLDRPAPAFLVGFPRSGTTLLDTFLMGHPDIVVIEEQPMLDAAGRVLGDQADLDRVDAATIARARAAYFVELDRHLPKGEAGQRLVIDKLPLAMTGAAVIHRLFPDARIIFARRHPADSVLSNFLQSFRMNDAMANFLDLHDGAQFYDVAMRLWTLARETLNLDTRDLVYEELVVDPAAALQPLVEWLGLPWDEALLDHQRTVAARDVIVTPSYDQVTQPIHRRAAGRWRRYMEQLEPVLPLLEPWALRLGYGRMTVAN